MNKKNIFQRIHDGSKFGKYALYTVLYAVIGISYVIGYVFWTLSRPLVALAHLFMLHPWTALDEIKEFNPSHSLKDLRL